MPLFSAFSLAVCLLVGAAPASAGDSQDPAADLPTYPVPAPPAPGPALDQLIVRFKSGVDRSEQKRAISRGKGARPRLIGRLRAGLVGPRSGVPIERVRKLLMRNPDVASVERDQYINFFKTPNDPLAMAQYQYALRGQTTGNIAATDAWGTLTKCSKVAVLDTGVDTDHADLKDNIWKNSKETPNNGRDDDGNGYVDDYYGVDIVDRVGNGEDMNGHGTHVAGTIGGRGNNSTGVTGVCWSAKIMSVRVMDATGSGRVSSLILGIDYALGKGAKVMNMSLGTSTKSSSLENAIKEAKDEGALIVAAAGNDTKNVDTAPQYPCAYTDSNILCVAASTSSDALASFSNYGKNAVDLAAPGDSIVSTYMGGYYAILSGTSMASPMIAGTAALLRKHDTDATYKDLRNAIRKSVDKLPAFSGTTYSGGRVNVQKALKKL